MRRLTLACLTLCFASLLHAGQNCTPRQAEPTAVADAAAIAAQVHHRLQASGRRVALLARAGTDLSRYGLVYSHIGLVVRDHSAGPWTVIHLLNTCGTAHSKLFAQGLINFFADDVYSLDALVMLPNEEDEQRLLQALDRGIELTMHQPRYNMVAPPYSNRSQNSNQWLLETVVASVSGARSRQQVHQTLLAQGFEPDRIRVPRLKRIAGGLTQANLTFSEHSLGARLRGEYQVVTVRSIRRHLERSGWVSHPQ